MNDLVIGEGTKVTLHFSLTLSDGEVVDSTFDHKPAIFVVGDGNFLPGFERKLWGLSAGAEDTFLVLPEEGFGQPNPNNIQEFPNEQFDDIELEKGLVLSFADAKNAELPGVVMAFNDDIVTIDFNHPLSGKEIHFAVNVLAVEPAVQH